MKRKDALTALTAHQTQLYRQCLVLLNDMADTHQGESGEFCCLAPEGMSDIDFEAIGVCLPRGSYFSQDDLMIVLF